MGDFDRSWGDLGQLRAMSSDLDQSRTSLWQICLGLALAMCQAHIFTFRNVRRRSRLKLLRVPPEGAAMPRRPPPRWAQADFGVPSEESLRNCSGAICDQLCGKVARPAGCKTCLVAWAGSEQGSPQIVAPLLPLGCGTETFCPPFVAKMRQPNSLPPKRRRVGGAQAGGRRAAPGDVLAGMRTVSRQVAPDKSAAIQRLSIFVSVCRPQGNIMCERPRCHVQEMGACLCAPSSGCGHRDGSCTGMLSQHPSACCAACTRRSGSRST